MIHSGWDSGKYNCGRPRQAKLTPFEVLHVLTKGIRTSCIESHTGSQITGQNACSHPKSWRQKCGTKNKIGKSIHFGVTAKFSQLLDSYEDKRPALSLVWLVTSIKIAACSSMRLKFRKGERWLLASKLPLERPILVNLLLTTLSQTASQSSLETGVLISPSLLVF